MATKSNGGNGGNTANRTLNLLRTHPQAKCSYGIIGRPGIVVFPMGFFPNNPQSVDDLPKTITLDVDLVEPGEDRKAAREAAAVKRAEEREAKAEARRKAAQDKAKAAQDKADKALADAQAKVAAAKGAAPEGDAASA